MNIVLSAKTKETLSEVIPPGEHESTSSALDAKSSDLGRELASLNRCLGVPCHHSKYQRMDYGIALWCGKRNSAVIDMMTCPDGLWTKNMDGYPTSLTINR